MHLNWRVMAALRCDLVIALHCDPLAIALRCDPLVIALHCDPLDIALHCDPLAIALRCDQTVMVTLEHTLWYHCPRRHARSTCTHTNARHPNVASRHTSHGKNTVRGVDTGATVCAC